MKQNKQKKQQHKTRKQFKVLNIGIIPWNIVVIKQQYVYEK